MLFSCCFCVIMQPTDSIPFSCFSILIFFSPFFFFFFNWFQLSFPYRVIDCGNWRRTVGRGPPAHGPFQQPPPLTLETIWHLAAPGANLGGRWRWTCAVHPAWRHGAVLSGACAWLHAGWALPFWSPGSVRRPVRSTQVGDPEGEWGEAPFRAGSRPGGF